MKNNLFGMVVIIVATIFGTGPLLGDVVYLKPDPEGTRVVKDGTSWAKAYSDVSAAVAAAGANPIYAAKGVYKISAQINIATDGFAIYGGFAGENESETIAGRDLVNDQTIFSGDVNETTAGQKDVWQHVETDGYSVTQSDTVIDVIVDGKINLPTSFTGDYDAYILKYDAGNTRRAFVVNQNIGATFDGIVLTGFIGLGYGNTGSAIMYNASTQASYIRNCRFVGCHNDGNNGVVYRTNGTGILYIEDTTFEFCSAKIRSSAVEGLGVTMIDRCKFIGCCRPAGNSGSNVVWFNALGSRIRNSEFVRCVTAGGTSAHDDNDSAPGNIVSGTYSYSICESVVSNCYSASEFGYGTPLLNLTHNSLVSGVTFINNRSLVKPAGQNRGYGMIGTSCRGGREYTFDNCSFKGNVIGASELDATSVSSYALGIIGNAVKGVRVATVGCVFDSNRAEGVSTEGVSAVLCRGVLSTAPDSTSDSQIGIANCTFTGPSGTGMYDVVQYGQHNRYLYIANTLFLLNDNGIANPFSFDVPAKVDLYSCTVQNAKDPPAGINKAPNYSYDKVPLADYVPQVRVPGIRETADVSTNDTSKVATTYVIRPYGEANFKELVYVTRSVTASPSAISDGKGVVRSFGSATRGAYQTMSALAEDSSAKALVVRCDPPFDGGITDGVNAQMVASGESSSAITVAKSSGAFVFTGWYNENNQQVYDATYLTLPAQSLSADTVLEARFKAAQNYNVTYDLGIYGGFVDTGLNIYTVSCSPGAAFPSAPAYTNATGWVISSWVEEIPATVPNHDVTIYARGVTTDLRIVYLVPASEAGENPDGTSWAKAYGDFNKAYTDAAACRGEVWIKKGVHVVTKPTTFVPNVEAVRGGFAGDETEASAADPVNNVTILTGDVNGNNYWMSESAANLGAIWTDGELSVPSVTSDIEKFFKCGGNSSDDTLNLLIGGSVKVTDVKIDGITMTGFGNAAIDTAASGCLNLEISRCRFIANNTRPNLAVAALYAGAGTSASAMTVRDTLFLGNQRAFQGASNAVGTNLFAGCRFESNYSSKSGASMRAAAQFQVCVTNCVFYRNFACSINGFGQPDDANEANNASAISLVGLRAYPAASMVVDCRFEDNRALGAAPGTVFVAGDHTTVEFRRCAFVKNHAKIVGDGAAKLHSPGLVTATANRSQLVRDCYFAGNEMISEGAGRYTASVVATAASNESLTFVNCTMERNVMTNATAGQVSGTVVAVNGIGFANCVFNANTLIEAREFSFADSPSFTLLNSTIRNTAAGYVAYDPGASVRKVDSRVSGVDATVPYVKSAKTKNGATACGIQESVIGRPLHLGSDKLVYFKDDGSDWRCLTSAGEVTAQTLSKVGISDASPIIPDAFGCTRKANRVICAAINAGSGLIMVYR